MAGANRNGRACSPHVHGDGRHCRWSDGPTGPMSGPPAPPPPSWRWSRPVRSPGTGSHARTTDGRLPVERAERCGRARGSRGPPPTQRSRRTRRPDGSRSCTAPHPMWFRCASGARAPRSAPGRSAAAACGRAGLLPQRFSESNEHPPQGFPVIRSAKACLRWCDRCPAGPAAGSSPRRRASLSSTTAISC